MPTRSQASLSHLRPAALAALLRAEIADVVSPTVVSTLEEVGGIGSERGAYLLALHLTQTVDLKVRRVRRSAAPGSYVYAGSAYGPGGLAARLRRHMQPQKAMHWHIDRLTVNAGRMAALAIPRGDECALVEALLGTGRFRVAIPGFGSSDCRRCEGHLLALQG